MKIFLDDLRDAPDETWTVFRNPWGFMNFLAHTEPGEIETISFDHDLAAFNYKGEERTGYWVLTKLEEIAAKYPETLDKIPSDLRIHSANPVGRKNMQAAINSIQKMHEEKENK